MKSAGIPCRYFCQRCFMTWDILLPLEELGKKLPRSNVMTKNFRFQPEYRGIMRIRVTLCSVSIHLNGEVLAAHMSVYSSVSMVRWAGGTAQGDYVLDICLNREGFQAICHILSYQDQQMMVVVEDRRPLCWSCKQLSHLARSCSQKLVNNNQSSNKINNSNNSSNQKKTISPTTNPAPKLKTRRSVGPDNRERKKNNGTNQKSNKKATTTTTKAAETTPTEPTPTESGTQPPSSPSKR